MKTVCAVIAALMFSSNARAMAMKTWAGQDDHGQPCNVMLGFENGKVVSVMVQALADEKGVKKPVKIWEMMLPEHFDKLIKQSGSLKKGKMYFQAKDTQNSAGVTLKRDMGLSFDMKRGVLTYEQHQKGAKNLSILMTCVGLKETKFDDPPGTESDACDLEENADMRNMCRVESGKKKGTIPEGAVAAPPTAK